MTLLKSTVTPFLVMVVGWLFSTPSVDMAVGRTPQLVVPVNTMEVRITTNTLLVMALVETMLPGPILETHKP